MPETKPYNDHTPVEEWTGPHAADDLTRKRKEDAQFAYHAVATYYETQAEITRLREQVEQRITVEQAMEVFIEHTKSCPSKGYDETWSEFDVREQNAFLTSLTKAAKP
jgi:hypothetical protein